MDDTLKEAVAKSPRVINKPFTDDESWEWDWTTDADALIEKFGWGGLAKACAYYDPDLAEEKDENGYPMSKAAYFLPHHKLIDGEITLVWGGVRAAMQRLFQVRARQKAGDIKTEIDFDEAYKHLAAHYKFFGKEPPPKDGESKGSLWTYEDLDDRQVVITDDLDVNDIYTIIVQMMEEWMNQARILLVDRLPFLKKDVTGENLDKVLDLLEVFDALKNKLVKLIALYKQLDNKTQGGLKMELLEQLKAKIEAGEIAKEAVMETLGLVEASVVEELKQELEAVREAKEKIEAEYAEFRQAVEAEKEARRKAELAEARFKELVEAGIEFSEERAEKVKAKLAEMNDEEFEDYKNELLDVLAAKKKKKAEDEVEDEEEAKKKKQEEEEEAKKKKSNAMKMFGVEDEEAINDEISQPDLAFELRRRRASLNLEYTPTEAEAELINKFHKILFGEVK